jgi:chromosome segregation ATPase
MQGGGDFMIRALLLLSISIPAFAQNTSTDAQLTQALLTEIRQLRQDLQTTAATIQRIQIVMFRLQTQSGIVSRATQRLDDVRRGCTQAQNNHNMMTGEIRRNEERLRTTQNPTEQKQIEDMLGRFKSQMEMFTNEEQQCHAREADADTQYRAEKAKMSELEDTLDKLDKVLAGVK